MQVGKNYYVSPAYLMQFASLGAEVVQLLSTYENHRSIDGIMANIIHFHWKLLFGLHLLSVHILRISVGGLL